MASSCDGSSVAPLTDYKNNPIYQELIDEDDKNEAKSDKRVYLDLRASSRYINEAERLERNNSKISSKPPQQKNKVERLGVFNRYLYKFVQIFVQII